MSGNVDFGDDHSIPKLMELLKTAFRPRHFDYVKEILMKREEKWRDGIERLKEENDVLRLDKVAVEDENNELKQLVFLVDRDRIASRERERRLVEKMYYGRGFGGEEVTELEKEKIVAQAVAAMWKNKFEDLEKRVSGLENDAMLLGLVPPVLNNNIDGLGLNGVVIGNGDFNVDHVKIEADVPECYEHTRPVGASTHHSPKAGNDSSREAGSREHKHRVFVEISDSDDDFDLSDNQMTSENSLENSHSKQMDREGGSVALERKQDSKVGNNSLDDITQPCKRTCLGLRARKVLSIEDLSSLMHAGNY